MHRFLLHPERVPIPRTSRWVPAAAALAVFAVITLLTLTPLGSFFKQPRSEALAENEVALTVHGKLELFLTAARGEEGMQLRLKFSAPDPSSLPKDLTLYTPLAFELSEVAGINIRSIAKVTHEDRTSYVIPLCTNKPINQKTACSSPEFRFSLPSLLPSLHLTHVGSAPLLLHTALLDIETRAVSRSTRILSGETDIPLVNEV